MFRLAQNSWEYETATGIGESVGMETTLSYNRPYFQSALSYTLSKTIRQFDEINDGLPFPYKFDRRHILNVQGKYQFAESKGENGAVKRHCLERVRYNSPPEKRKTCDRSDLLRIFSTCN